MNYEINKRKLYIKYKYVSWASGEPYWVSNATFYAPAEPIDSLHYHNMYETGICMEGCGEYQINNRVYSFQKGDIVFVNQFTPHNSNSKQGYPAKWKIVFFDPVRLMQLAGMLDPEKNFLNAEYDMPFSGVFSPDEHPQLTDFIRNIIALAEVQDEFTDMTMAFSIGNFIIACKRYLKTHEISTKSFTVSKSNYHKITPAVSMISSHMSNSKMIEEEALAKLCKMSVSNMRRLFKKHTGLSPKAYINNTRMSYAEYLVSNTDMTVLKIANEVGYSEVSGFNRIFKATFGVSPSDYRNTR